MDFQTVLTHGLTYLAALALPLWLLGEQLLGWWTLRRPKVDKARGEGASRGGQGRGGNGTKAA